MAISYKQQIDLNELPIWESGNCKGKINWEQSKNKKVHFIYNNIEGDIEIIDYIKIKYKKNKLKIKYNQYEGIVTINTLQYCKLGIFLKNITKYFKYEIGQVFKDDNRDITIIDREYRTDKNGIKRKWYKYECNICSWTEGWLIEGNLLDRGCSCCHGNTVVEGINDISTTTPWLIPYFCGGIDEAKLYTKTGGGNPNNREGKIHPICPDCGRIKTKEVKISNIYYKRSIGCSCGDGVSYPNKFAFNLLEQLNIDFETEYSPSWIKPRAYDFYIPSLNIIIEMDGGLGHGKGNFKNNMSAKESQEIDDYKDKQAKLHGVKVIRIDCDISELNYIKENILSNEKMIELFDLSNIDWIKIENFAVSNRVKESCELWNNGIDSTKKIGEIMKLHQATIVRYLKRGNINKWCQYDSKKEIIKNGIMSGSKKGKQVEIFKDGISLGIFESASELERQSEKLFGIKMNGSNIRLVCSGKNKTYKGYTFKYV